MTAAVVLTLVVVAAAITGVRSYFSRRAAHAADALALAMSVEDVSKRNEALAVVTRDYSSTSAGREAMAILGNDAYARNDIDEAIGWYMKLASHGRGYPALHVYALHRLGELYGKQGKWKKAASVYEEASRVRGNLVRGWSMYEAARALERAGSINEARTRYEQLRDMDDDTARTVRMLSEERLIWLSLPNQSAG